MIVSKQRPSYSTCKEIGEERREKGKIQARNHHLRHLNNNNNDNTTKSLIIILKQGYELLKARLPNCQQTDPFISMRITRATTLEQSKLKIAHIFIIINQS